MSKKVGIDVSQSELKYVQISDSRSDISILKAKSIKLPQMDGVTTEEGMMEVHEKGLAEIFDQLGISSIACAIALPTSDCYMSIIEMPLLSDAELSSSINWEAEQHLPVSVDEVYKDHQVLYRPKKARAGEFMEVLLVASRKSVVDHWLDVAKRVGVDVSYIEPKILSVYRAISHKIQENENVLILDMNDDETGFLVLSEGRPNQIGQIKIGSEAFFRAISNDVSVNISDITQFNGVANWQSGMSVGLVMSQFVKEITKAVEYAKTASKSVSVQKIIMSGKLLQLTGFSDFMTKSTGITITPIDVFAEYKVVNNFELPAETQGFLPSVGVVMALE